MAERQPVLGYAWRDGTGTLGTCRFNLRAGITVAEGHAAGDTLRGILSGFVGAVPVRQSVVYPVTVDSPTVALPGSRIENQAAFIFSTTDSEQLLAVSICGIREQLVRQIGPHFGLELETTDQAVLDLIAEIIGGLWCNPFGYSAVELVSTVVETVD